MTGVQGENWDGADPRPSPGPPGVPRWLKVLVGVFAILAMLVLLLAMLGGGQHGPGRHQGGGILEGSSYVAAGTADASFEGLTRG